MAKFKIFRNGIALNYIPCLSSNCKKEIEGSFKITGDRELQSLALQQKHETFYSKTYIKLMTIISDNENEIKTLKIKENDSKTNGPAKKTQEQDNNRQSSSDL